MKLLPLVVCATSLTACTAGTPNDSFVANVQDLEDLPADNDASHATPAATPLPQAETNGTAPVQASTRDLTGRWTGVEGTYLIVSPASTPGRYRLEMQYDLDHKQTVEGRADGDAIVIERDGTPKRLRPTDGNATGLKWLADKRDCLTVARGEGYCRA